MDGENNKAGTETPAAGIEHLIAARQAGRKPYNSSYSRTVRWLRLTLPLMALAITAVVFTWSGPRQPLLTRDQPELKQTVGKNELLNPRFENTDSENRPYTLTAARAVQDEQDGNIVILENPSGDMILKDEHWVALEAREGAFEQDLKKLLLRGNVRLYHNAGYLLQTPELHIDLPSSSAFSDKEVQAQGPEGTLEAAGLEGRNSEGILVFKGPVKLVLNTENSGAGGMFQ